MHGESPEAPTKSRKVVLGGQQQQVCREGATGWFFSFFAKGPEHNFSVSAAITQLCPCSSKATVDNR